MSIVSQLFFRYVPPIHDKAAKGPLAPRDFPEDKSTNTDESVLELIRAVRKQFLQKSSDESQSDPPSILSPLFQLTRVSLAVFVFFKMVAFAMAAVLDLYMVERLLLPMAKARQSESQAEQTQNTSNSNSSTRWHAMTLILLSAFLHLGYNWLRVQNTFTLKKICVRVEAALFGLFLYLEVHTNNYSTKSTSNNRKLNTESASKYELTESDSDDATSIAYYQALGELVYFTQGLADFTNTACALLRLPVEIFFVYRKLSKYDSATEDSSNPYLLPLLSSLCFYLLLISILYPLSNRAANDFTDKRNACLSKTLEGLRNVRGLKMFSDLDRKWLESVVLKRKRQEMESRRRVEVLRRVLSGVERGIKVWIMGSLIAFNGGSGSGSGSLAFSDIAGLHMVLSYLIFDVVRIGEAVFAFQGLKVSYERVNRYVREKFEGLKQNQEAGRARLNLNGLSDDSVDASLDELKDVVSEMQTLGGAASISQQQLQVTNFPDLGRQIKDVNHGSKSNEVELIRISEKTTFSYQNYGVQNDNHSNENFRLRFDPNFSINSGDICLVRGVTGSGKTSVISALLGLDALQKETESSSDRSTAAVNNNYPAIKPISLSYAYALQHAPLLNGSIRENIMFGLDNNMSSLYSYCYRRAIRMAEFEEIFDESVFPFKDETQLSATENLSGGQIQRIGIARAFLKMMVSLSPAEKLQFQSVTSVKLTSVLLVLDNPCSALDEETSRKILENLKFFLRKSDRRGRVGVVLTETSSSEADLKESPIRIESEDSDFEAVFGHSDTRRFDLEKSGDVTVLREADSSNMVVSETTDWSSPENLNKLDLKRCSEISVNSDIAEPIKPNDLTPKEDHTNLSSESTHRGPVSLEVFYKQLTIYRPVSFCNSCNIPAFLIVTLALMVMYGCSNVLDGGILEVFREIDKNQRNGTVSSDSTSNTLRNNPLWYLLLKPTSNNVFLCTYSSVALLFLASILLWFSVIVVCGSRGASDFSLTIYRNIFLRRPLVGFFDRQSMGRFINRFATDVCYGLYKIVYEENGIRYIDICVAVVMFFVTNVLLAAGSESSDSDDLSSPKNWFNRISTCLLLMFICALPLILAYFFLISSFRVACREVQRFALQQRSLRDSTLQTAADQNCKTLLKVHGVQAVFFARAVKKELTLYTRACFTTEAVDGHLKFYLVPVVSLMFLLVKIYECRILDFLPSDSFSTCFSMLQCTNLSSGPGLVVNLKILLDEQFFGMEGFFRKLPEYERLGIVMERLVEYADNNAATEPGKAEVQGEASETVILRRDLVVNDFQITREGSESEESLISNRGFVEEKQFLLAPANVLQTEVGDDEVSTGSGDSGDSEIGDISGFSKSPSEISESSLSLRPSESEDCTSLNRLNGSTPKPGPSPISEAASTVTVFMPPDVQGETPPPLVPPKLRSRLIRKSRSSFYKLSKAVFNKRNSNDSPDVCLSLRNVNVRYNYFSPNTNSKAKKGKKLRSPNALSRLSLDIIRGEKVFLHGRTGSGKSSLFLALLQLVRINSSSSSGKTKFKFKKRGGKSDSSEPFIKFFERKFSNTNKDYNGILLNAPTSVTNSKRNQELLKCEDIRKHVITAFPQKPMVFRGSFFFNVCPNFDEASEHEKRTFALPVLKKLFAKFLRNFENQNDNLSLYECFDGGGASGSNGNFSSNFSDISIPGFLSEPQKQLLHAARVLTWMKFDSNNSNTTKVSTPSIFLLDEVTATAGAREAPALVRSILSELPEASTIICISHQKEVAKCFGTKIQMENGRLKRIERDICSIQ